MIRSLIRRVLWWNKLQDDTARLRALDDALLVDIGIDRADIGALVRGRRRRG
jgi:uncharacterized protein YjiS (DUF1127 family)